MEEQSGASEKFVRAQKQVERIKKFYGHLRVYIVVNLVILAFKFQLFDYFTGKGIADSGFYNWLDWNIIATPVLWGIGLLVHGLVVFKFGAITWKTIKPKALERWEDEQLEKFIREEEEKQRIAEK